MNVTNFKEINRELRETIGDHYGIDIGFISLSESNSYHQKMMETLKRNAGAPLIVTHKAMVIPARKAGVLLGAVLICGILTFEPFEVADITRRVQNLLIDLLPHPHPSPESNVIRLFA